MTKEREYDEVEIGLGLIKLGDCDCRDPMIIDGRKVYASQYCAYSRTCPGCDNFKPYKEGRTQSCGNCKFWVPREGIDAYE